MLGVESVLKRADALYLQLTNGRPPARVYSADLLPVLCDLVPSDSAAYGDVLEDFVRQHRSELQRSYAQFGPGSGHAEDGTYELAQESESLILLERIDWDMFTVKDVWLGHDAVSDLALERLAEIRGISIWTS